MTKVYLYLLSFFVFLFSFTSHAQNLYINEFLSSNSNTLADEDGDYEDWVEIYNAENFPVNLNGFGLSDDLTAPDKWTFPDTIIQPGEFILVWTSGKDRKNIGQPLHTSWSISASGEDLLLTDTSGNLLDHISPINLLTDLSYGRFPNGGQDFFYFQTPTPGAANLSNGFEEFLASVEFSHAGGFYTDSFYLVLSHPSPGATSIIHLMAQSQTQII